MLEASIAVDLTMRRIIPPSEKKLLKAWALWGKKVCGHEPPCDAYRATDIARHIGMDLDTVRKILIRWTVLGWFKYESNIFKGFMTNKGIQRYINIFRVGE